MERNLQALQKQAFDLIVIGGGIYGACVAWDASLRGLSVALVEKGDFGGATSANSLKIMHGGLRYLKDGNLGLVRMMIRERAIWLRAAPHLVQPMPFVMPTGRGLQRHKLVLFLALTLTNILGASFQRRRGSDKRLPGSRLISRKACQSLAHGILPPDMTGGAIWYDGIIKNSERLLLSVILSAAENGAIVANYVKVTGISSNGDLRSVTACDDLSGHTFKMRGRIVVNCTGPWTNNLLKLVDEPVNQSLYRPSIALNLVTRQLVNGHALGVPYKGPASEAAGEGPSRMLFIVPWHNYSLIGTWHAPSPELSPEKGPAPELVQEFVDVINASLQRNTLSASDICRVQWGYLPVVTTTEAKAGVRLVRQSLVYDHQRAEGVGGLITVVGVKYTSARATAEKVVDLAIQKLGRPKSESRTVMEPLHGGKLERLDKFVAEAHLQDSEILPAPILNHLVNVYGSEYGQILALVRQNTHLRQRITPAAPVIAAEVVHAARAEMAQTLDDVIRRRTILGTVEIPDEASLDFCAQLMAKEMGWDEFRRVAEIDSVRRASVQHRS